MPKELRAAWRTEPKPREIADRVAAANYVATHVWASWL